jgi:hypothetical protein
MSQSYAARDIELILENYKDYSEYLELWRTGSMYDKDLKGEIKKAKFNINWDSILAYHCIKGWFFVQFSTDIYVFTNEAAYYRYGKCKAIIYYNKLKNVTYDNEEMVVYYNDGTQIKIKGDIFIKDFARILGQIASLVNPNELITHRNVDYEFPRFIDKSKLPEDFATLEKMCIGYKTMPSDDPNRLTISQQDELAHQMLSADLDDKYLQMKADYGIKSGKCKLMAKRINGYKNLSSIVSEIWSEIISDYQKKVKEPYVSESRLSDGKYFTVKVFGFEILMNELKTRAEKEIRNGEKPVAYAAYQVFNPSLSQLERSKFASFEGQPISEVLGKSPSAADVMKLFNIPTYKFYEQMSSLNPYAWLFFHSLTDMQEVTTKTEYLPFSSVAEDYSLDDLKYIANYKRYMDEEYKQTGKVDADSHGAQMVRQFNEDRKIETVTKGERYSSFYKYPCEYVFSDRPEKYSQMSYIDYLVKDHNTDARCRGYAWLKRDQNYLSQYEEMSDNGFLLFTCFLCEKGEQEIEYTTTTKFFKRRDEQYAQLRRQIDAMYKR